MNPLEALTEDELWNTQLVLALACARNHSPLAKKRRQYYCGLQEILRLESDQRGVTFPNHPYHVGDLRFKA